jgi:hypothetical protein
VNPKSGQAGSAVEPAVPKQPEEADVADPGEVSELRAQQRQAESGKYGSQPAPAFKPGGAEEGEEAQEDVSWIEIELVGEDGEPIPGERYRVKLPDGSVDKGTLDHNGWARVAGFAEGQCTISFPDLDQDAWEFAESLGSRVEEDH